jgi:hypothetical protein
MGGHPAALKAGRNAAAAGEELQSQRISDKIAVLTGVKDVDRN